MRGKLSELINYLYEKGLNHDKILGIINPLETPTQVTILMEWIQKNQVENSNEIFLKAREIVKNS